jgi:NAD(P)-dependent dehydrogenase (short-subunit alcohol dehydrogenase family)
MANIIRHRGTTRGSAPRSLSSLKGHNVIGHPAGAATSRYAADLGGPEQGKGRFVERRMGGLDAGSKCCIINAGKFEATPIEQGDDGWLEGWERTVQVNLTASQCSAASPCSTSAKTGGGRIVNVASRAAYRGDSPQHWHYAASKAGWSG